MAKRDRAVKHKPEKKRQPQPEPAAVEELEEELTSVTALPAGPAVASGGTIEAQAARLGDARLPSAQRQALAAQIGRTQGNRYLQRVVTAAKDDQSQAVTRQLNAVLSSVGAGPWVAQRAGGAAAANKGDPFAPALPGTSRHPTVKRGSKGPAVKELQQKLNAAGAKPRLAVDGVYGRRTHAAAAAFQRRHALKDTGIAGPSTWAKMDKLGLASTVGRVEKKWEERVGGQTYGMTSRYTWRIKKKEIRITVRLQFTGHGGSKRATGIPLMFAAIRHYWNRFNAVNTDTGETLRIVFDPQSVGSGGDNVVKLIDAAGRSDASNWYLQDPDLPKTAAHEFGHMVGLEDEYQRSHRDYKRLTGEEPGKRKAKKEASPGFVSWLMHIVLGMKDWRDRVVYARKIIKKYGLAQGDYAQAVAAAYKKKYGVKIVDDIVARIPDKYEWGIVDPFTYSSPSLMGMGTDHAHPVAPRHVREFVGYVAAAKGGKWKAELIP